MKLYLSFLCICINKPAIKIKDNNSFVILKLFLFKKTPFLNETNELQRKMQKKLKLIFHEHE